MTRKDYVLIAETLRYCAAHCDTADESILIDWVSEHMAGALASDNARFNFDRFMKAARLA